MSEKPSSPAVKAARMKLDRAKPAQSLLVADPEAPGGFQLSLPIIVADITETGDSVAESLPQPWLTALLGGEEGAVLGWWASDDGKIDLHLREENPELLRLTGEGQFQLKHSCVRCLQEVEFPLTLIFDLKVVEGVGEIFAGEAFDLDPQKLAQKGDEEGGEPLGDDDDLVTYQGTELDIAVVVREQILLEVPMHPRCDDEGMIAEGPCQLDDAGRARQEAERWVDPRWEGLIALKDRIKN